MSALLLAQCFSLLFAVQTLNVTILQIPSFSTTHLAAHYYNLSCSNVVMSQMQYFYSADTVAAETRLPARLTCRINLDWQAYCGVLNVDVTIFPSTAQIDLVKDKRCYAASATIERCATQVKINQIQAVPPDRALDLMLPQLQHAIEATAERYLCNVSAPRLVSALTNSTLPPPTPPPHLQPDARPMSTVILFKAMQNIVAASARSAHFHSRLIFVNDTVLRVIVHADKGWPIKARWPAGKVDEHGGSSLLLKHGAPNTHQSIERRVNSQVLLTSVIEKIIKIETAEFAGHLKMNMVAGMSLEVDIAFNDLRCNDMEGYVCSVPRQGGIQLTNLRVQGSGTMDRIVDEQVAPTFAALCNHFITQVINTTNYTDALQPGADRYVIPMRPKARRYEGPGCFVIVAFIIIALIHLGTIVRYDVKHYSEHPLVYTTSGTQVPMRRLLFEDGVLCSSIFTCMGCFLWSNMANAATVIVGSELEVYTFSLISTARDLYAAGLWPLAFFVILFSGIYPYFKLYTILVYTTVLHKPHAKALELIDLFGKFSFLDAFVMIIMVSGLEIEQIVDVRIELPYYVFVFSTVVSILIGNYATNLWRKGIDEQESEQERRIQDSNAMSTNGMQTIIESEAYTDSDQIDARIQLQDKITALHRYTGTIAYSIIIILIIPAWILPAIDFNVKGMATVITKKYISMTMLQLSTKAGFVNTVITVTTTVLAPVLHALYYKQFPFLASWCATDVLLLACVASVLQLQQFTEFIAGENMESFYAASVKLQLPVYGLLPATILTWRATLHTWTKVR